MGTRPIHEDEFRPGSWSIPLGSGVFTIVTGSQLLRVRAREGSRLILHQGLSYFGDTWRMVTRLELIYAP